MEVGIDEGIPLPK